MGLHRLCGAVFGGDHKGSFCHSHLTHHGFIAPFHLCNKLPAPWRQLDSSHPKSPVSSCLHFSIQKGMAEMSISLKQRLLSPALSFPLDLKSCCLQHSDIYLNCYHILLFIFFFSQFSFFSICFSALLIWPFSRGQIGDRTSTATHPQQQQLQGKVTDCILCFLLTSFHLKVAGMQSLTAAWLPEVTSADCAKVFLSCPSQTSKAFETYHYAITYKCLISIYWSAFNCMCSMYSRYVYVKNKKKKQPLSPLFRYTGKFICCSLLPMKFLAIKKEKAVSHCHGDNVVNTIRISAPTDILRLLEKEENE